ncbi:MAG: carbohydrate ABC transporter permease, partial [Acetatifactor sp.]|nr:carbohydrate ABC transporter permease [Acetatifactor sp.]
MNVIAYVKNKYNRRKFKRRNRSLGGDAILLLVLAFFGIFSLFPLLYTLTSAFKPFSEIFMYPPKLTVENPTLNNFFDLGTIIEDFTVPLSRYIFNTLVITGLGTFGTVLLGSM